MDAKSQNLANRSKRKMQQALHAEKAVQKNGGDEPHFFHTHKVATEPIQFGPKPEIPEPTMKETLSEYASEAAVLGKALLEEGATLVKKAEGPARKLATAAKKLIVKPRKTTKPIRKAAAASKTAAPKRKRGKAATKHTSAAKRPSSSKSKRKPAAPRRRRNSIAKGN